MTWLTVPNAISLSRVLLVPVFAALFLGGSPLWALGVFAVASVSDLLDGFLARVLNQRSKVGGILDGAADKLLVFTALVVLIHAGRLPAWLLGLMLLRDVPMAVGAFVVRRRLLQVQVAPSRVGKYATFALVLTIVLALWAQTARGPAAVGDYVAAVGFVAALCVVVSTVQYWVRFGYLLVRPPPGAPERASV